MSSYYTVDDYWYQGPHGQDRRSHYTWENVWHLVRHPLKTINSIANEMPVAWWHWQQVHTGISLDEPKLVRSMKFWCDWSERSDAQAQRRIRLEDIDAEWPSLCGALGIEAKDLSEVHAHKRPQPLEPIGWENLRSESVSGYDAVRKLAEKFGYE